jgi:glucosamine kinase
MARVIAIDGGGSGVRAAVVDAGLRVLGQGTAGPGNPNTVGPDAASANLQSAMRAALAEAESRPEQIGGVCAGVAGIMASGRADWLAEVLAGVCQAAVIRACADYEIALAGAHGGQPGMLILAGTGSLACGANAAGQTALIGAWGYLLGDEGGGFWLGMRGLRAAIRAGDGTGPATSLLDVLQTTLALPSLRDLVGWLYRPEGIPTREVAALAPLVLAQAEAGDGVAGEIVQAGAAYLYRAAGEVQRRLDLPEGPFAFAGSLLTTNNPLSWTLCRALGLPTIPPARHAPLIGAALLAFQTLGIEPTQETF